MLKAVSLITAVGLGLSSLTLTSAPAKAGGEAVAAGIIGFTAGAIVGSQARPHYRPYRHYYYGPRHYRSHYRPVYRAPRRSAEERQYWMSIQDALNRSGYAAGPVDGAPGRLTRSAIRQYQLSIPAEPTGTLTADQTAALFAGLQAPNANVALQSGPGVAPETTAKALGNEELQTGSVAPDAANDDAAAPRVQIDDDGRPFIVLDGRKFFLQSSQASASGQAGPSGSANQPAQAAQ